MGKIILEKGHVCLIIISNDSLFCIRAVSYFFLRQIECNKEKKPNDKFSF